MKHWILAAATLLLVQGVDAREHWGPPPACPQPKVDCNPCKPKCKPAPCKPAPCKPKCEPCKPVCDPCCPPVCFERGHPTNACCTPKAYSESAAIDLLCGWDVFATGSFLYWEAMQEGMDLAVPGQATVVGGVITADTLGLSACGYAQLEQKFEYKPGFQVGLGWTGGEDNWVVYAEYTWLHGTSKTSSTTAPAPNVTSISGMSVPTTGVWIPASWFNSAYSNNASTTMSSSWNYKIDYVDAQISRPYYSGARFTVEPFFGLRGAWIRQHMSVTATNLSTSTDAAAGPSRTAKYQSRSSGVGPRVGMNGNWLLCWGFRFIGDAAASLLFTGYDVKQNVQSPTVPGAGVATALPVKTKLHDVNFLRPNMELSLGLGWGSYFCCRRMHWDLSATYDFNIFWGQNMMRYVADVAANIGSDASGAAQDLYLQGLTIKTRFDF